MNFDPQSTIKVASFSMLQSAFIPEGLLDKNGMLLSPKKMKNKTLIEQDAIWVYSWLVNQLKSFPDSLFSRHVELYNETVKKFHDQYLVDDLIVGTGLLERWVLDYGGATDKILLERRLSSLIKYARIGVLKHHKNGNAVVKDSLYASDNAYRLLTGKPELTKGIRAKRVERWRNMAANKKKNKEFKNA